MEPRLIFGNKRREDNWLHFHLCTQEVTVVRSHSSDVSFTDIQAVDVGDTKWEMLLCGTHRGLTPRPPRPLSLSDRVPSHSDFTRPLTGCTLTDRNETVSFAILIKSSSVTTHIWNRFTPFQKGGRLWGRFNHVQSKINNPAGWMGITAITLY